MDESKVEKTEVVETANEAPPETGEKKGAITPALRNLNKKTLTYIGACVVVVIAMIVAVALAGSSGSSKTLSKELQAAADARTELVVGVNSAYSPPFLYMDYSGYYAGTDYDLMAAVCKEYGWKLTIKEIDWSQKDTILTSGEVDCLWSGMNMYGLEDFYTWTSVYQDESDVVLALKKNAKNFTELEDLDNTSVAVVSASTASRTLEGFGLTISRHSCEEPQDCIDLLKDGTVDYVVMRRSDAEEMLESNKGVVIMDAAADYKQYAVACGEEDASLVELLNFYFENN
jgi:polar amino acid transport system substrate-binding protein